jgi:hypothetical protein
MRHLDLVEERQGSTRLFPHTKQLPCLYNAIKHEFLSGISSRLARTDHRADPYRKFMLSHVMEGFCMLFNNGRANGLVAFPYFTRQGVAQLTIVQEISQSGALGKIHRYRFFDGKQFLPSVHLSGKPVAFTTHVLDRFRQRAAKVAHVNFGELLRVMFTVPVLGLRANGHGMALAPEFWSLAFPFLEHDTEILFTTCLTDNELRELTPLEPPRLLMFHYGQEYQVPRSRKCTATGVREITASYVAQWRQCQIDTYNSMPARAEWFRGWSLLAKSHYWHSYAKRLETGSHPDWDPNWKWDFLEGLYGPCMLPSPSGGSCVAPHG